MKYSKNKEIVMSVKQAVLEMIQKMPEDASVPDIMAELFFRERVDEGLRQADGGLTIPHEEVVQTLRGLGFQS
jgi:predicted transcriptional regulator